MNGKKVLGWGCVLLIVFFVVAQPGQAADLVHTIITWLKEAAGQLVAFIKGVASGRA